MGGSVVPSAPALASLLKHIFAYMIVGVGAAASSVQYTLTNRELGNLQFKMSFGEHTMLIYCICIEPVLRTCD